MNFANPKIKDNRKTTAPVRYSLLPLPWLMRPHALVPRRSICAGALRCLQRPRGPAFAHALSVRGYPLLAAGHSAELPRRPLVVVAARSPRLSEAPVGSASVEASPQPQSGGDLRGGRRRHSAVGILRLSRECSISATAPQNRRGRFWRPSRRTWRPQGIRPERPTHCLLGALVHN